MSHRIQRSGAGLLALAAVLLAGCAGGLPSDLGGADVETEFQAVVEAVSSDSWLIGGQQFTISLDTQIEDAIQVGDRVEVRARLDPDGSLVAREIDLVGAEPHQDGDDASDEIEFVGQLEALGADSWSVAGRTIAVTADTEIEDILAVGDLVKVHATVDAQGDWTAREITLAREERDPGDDHRPQEWELVGTVQGIGTSAWTIDGILVLVGQDTEIQDGLAVGDMVKVQGHLGSDGSPIAREFQLLHEEEPAHGEEPGHTEEITFEGPVQAISPDAWVVGGHAVMLTTDTKIEDGIAVGDVVSVEARLSADGSLTAESIERAEDPHVEDQDGEENQENHERHDEDHDRDHERDEEDD